MASRVHDATSFYAGIPFSSQEVSYTTPQVFEEVRHIKKSQGAVSVLLDTGRLKIVEPEEKFTRVAISKAQETGDYQTLTGEDVSVIALCLQIGGELVTDDFAVSNVAKHLGLTVFPVMTGGAKMMEWVYYCAGCGTTSSKESACPVCGSSLRRKAKNT
ncbi:MAG TPA: nucleotide-binding protein [Candidatus Nitrosotalea sp.]|nr:nucleotide-binding protein [Candidatus Nitrosotalea sp.]